MLTSMGSLHCLHFVKGNIYSKINESNNIYITNWISVLGGVETSTRNNVELADLLLWGLSRVLGGF